MFDPPKRSLEQVEQAYTEPSAMLETAEETIKGHPYKVYKNLPPSICAMWCNAASTHAEKEYIIHNGLRMTYKQVHIQVELVAQKLIHCGVKKGDKVAIISRNTPEYIILYWAIHRVGAISVLVNAWQTKTVVLACLDKTRPKVIMADDQRAKFVLDGENLIKMGVRSAVVASPTRKYNNLQAWQDWVPRPGQFPPPPSLGALSIQPEDDATIYFTSGTTGIPKAVLSTQRQSLTNAFNSIWAVTRGKVRRGEPAPVPKPDDPQRIFLLMTPLFHVTGNCTYLHLYTLIGGKIVIQDKWEIKQAIKNIKEEKITNLGGVPSQSAEIFQENVDLSGFIGSSFGGAPPTTQLASLGWKKLPKTASLTNAYGLTETNAIVFANSDEDFVKRPDSVGTPSPVNEAKIMGSDGKEAPNGTLGELWMRGPNVAECYFGNEKATAESFDKDHWFASGDLAYRDNEGFFYIKDRLKDVIIRGGENIASGAVEAGIYKDERVLDCCVVAVPDPKLNELPAGMVYLKAAYRSKVKPEEIISIASKHLPKHETPVFIHISDKPLPVNANGKIQKRDLKLVLADLYMKHKRGSKL